MVPEYHVMQIRNTAKNIVKTRSTKEKVSLQKKTKFKTMADLLARIFLYRL